MNIVLASAKIDSKIKHRILNEFWFTDKNPQYSPDLEKAVGFSENDKSSMLRKKLKVFSR
jgi:hypothetical protein